MRQCSGCGHWSRASSRVALHQQRWDGRDDAGRQVASGTYVCRLEMPAVGLSQMRTMSVVR